jgi:hypothetical protein
MQGLRLVVGEEHRAAQAQARRCARCQSGRQQGANSYRRDLGVRVRMDWFRVLGGRERAGTLWAEEEEEREEEEQQQ